MNKWQLGSLMLVASAFTLTLGISLRYGKPVGADIHFHLEIVEEWASGRNGMFSPLVMKVNRVPYPPLFHLLIVPSFWLGLEYGFVCVLQVLFLPLTLAGAIWLVTKHSGSEAGFYCGMLLLSSLAFTDRLLQPIPQSLDFMLFPIIVYAYLQKKRKTFVLASLAMVYNHGVVAMAFIGGVGLLSVFEKRRTELLQISTFSMPILVISLLFLIPAMQTWGPLTDTPQERAFYANPYMFISMFLSVLTVGFFLAIYLSLFKRKQLTQLQKISILTLSSLFIMLPLWVDRWVGYVVMPLAFLLCHYIVHMNIKLKIVVVPLLFSNFLFFYSMPWLWLINDTIHVL